MIRMSARYQQGARAMAISNDPPVRDSATLDSIGVAADSSRVAIDQDPDASPAASPHGSDAVVDVLNELLENACDAERRFRAFAREMPSPSKLRRALNRRASHYHEACDELARSIQRHGGSPIEGGSPAEAIRRGWVHVKAVVGSASESSMLEECAHGEDAAVALCLQAMKRDLPSDVRILIRRHAAAAQRSRDQIKRLREQAG
jgi:uncharacterized protein (TIGR02284 family)